MEWHLVSVSNSVCVSSRILDFNQFLPFDALMQSLKNGVFCWWLAQFWGVVISVAVTQCPAVYSMGIMAHK